MAQALRHDDRFKIEIKSLKNAGTFHARALDTDQVKVHLSQAEHADKLRQLERVAEGSSDFPEAPQITDILIYKKNNRSWCRGRVERVRDDKLFLRDVDTAAPAVNVSIVNTRPLPTELHPPIWPPDILQCVLAKVKPISYKVVDGQLSNSKLDATVWDQAATDEISRLIKDKILTCQVVKIKPSGLIEVMMWAQSNSKDSPQCVNEFLVRKKFARVLKEQEQEGLPPLVAREAPTTTKKITTTYVPEPQKKRISGLEPLIIGPDPVRPVCTVEECKFYEKIESQYKQGRGAVALALVQKYGWPVMMEGRDGIFVFLDRSRSTDLTFIIPILSKVASGTYSSLPKNFSPKVVIIVPSCKDCDDIYRYCEEYLFGAMKYAMSVRRAYSYSKSAPHPELWNNQDILIATPESLVNVWKEHQATDGSSIYFSNTCHIVLHNSHDLFTQHSTPMSALLPIIKQELETRDNSLSCQISLFSHIWLPVFAKIAMTYLSRPTIILEYRTEAALYAGVKTRLEEYSSKTILQEAFLKLSRQECDKGKRVIVFTEDDEKAKFLYKVLKSQAIPCHLLDDTGEAIGYWTAGNCLVTSDHMAERFVIDSADIVLHFTMPGDLKTFSNRLCSMEHYYSGYNEASNCYSCFFLCDEEKAHVYQIVNYLKRYNCEIPESLALKAKEGEVEKELMKESQPLCYYFKQYGSCNYRGCANRHIIRPTDKPGTDLKIVEIPTSGKIQVKVTAVADGNRFYVQMISVSSGTCLNTVEQFERDQAKLQELISDTPRHHDDKKLEPGTIVVVKDPIDNQYYRAVTIAKFYNADIKGTMDQAKVRYLDTGLETQVNLSKIYKIPDRPARKPSAAVEVIVCGIRPSENDRVFSSHCKNMLQQIVGSVMEGNIELALGNTLWVKTLESRVLLKALKLRSSSISVKKLLIDNEYGVLNPEHTVLLKEKLKEAIPQSTDIIGSEVSTPEMLSLLDLTKQHTVCISHVNTPHDFYVQLSDNIESLEELAEEVNKDDMLDSLGSCWLAPDNYCLAKYSKDAMWYRGRVVHTWHDKYHIFFVDYGNREKTVPSNNVKPIPIELLQLPFQAIPCSLSDVLPIGSDWSSSVGQVLTNMTVDADLCMKIDNTEDPDKLSVTLSTLEDDLVGDLLAQRGSAIHLAIKDSPLYTALIKLHEDEEDLEDISSDIKQYFLTSSSVTRAEFVAVCRVIKLRGADESVVLLLEAISSVVDRQVELQDVLLTENVFPPLLALLSSSLSSSLHTAIAQLIATVGKNSEVKALLLELNGIVVLCGLCFYNKHLSDKLVNVLRAVRALCEGSVEMCKELKVAGHIRTLSKLVGDSHDTLLKEALETVYVICTTYNPAIQHFRDERGLKEVCRAVRRSNSPFILHLLILFEDKESLNIMVREGLGQWIKRYKIKSRDFAVKMLCSKVEAKIKEFEKTLPAPSEPVPTVIQVMREPIDNSRLDMPALIGCKKVINQVHPTLLWHQRKRKVGLSIQIKDIGTHTLQLKDQELSFSTWNGGIHYTFSHKLFGGVSNMRKQVNKSELIIQLDKHPITDWKSLLLEPGKHCNIKLDFSRAVDSDDETASEGEVFVSKPVRCDANTVICIGGSEEEEELLTDEENYDDIGYWRNVGMAFPNSDSDHMEGLE